MVSLSTWDMFSDMIQSPDDSLFTLHPHCSPFNTAVSSNVPDGPHSQRVDHSLRGNSVSLVSNDWGVSKPASPSNLWETSLPGPSQASLNMSDSESPVVLKRKRVDEGGTDELISNLPCAEMIVNERSRSSSHRKSSIQEESRYLKKRQQNRAAQRAFRERRDRRVRELEEKVATLEAQNQQKEHENFQDLLRSLQRENMMLKTTVALALPDHYPVHFPDSVFTPAPMFDTSLVPGLDNLPIHGSLQSPQAHSGLQSFHLDLNTLIPFDPTTLNILDDIQASTLEESSYIDFEGLSGMSPGSDEVGTSEHKLTHFVVPFPLPTISSPYTPLAAPQNWSSPASSYDNVWSPGSSSQTYETRPDTIEFSCPVIMRQPHETPTHSAACFDASTTTPMTSLGVTSSIDTTTSRPHTVDLSTPAVNETQTEQLEEQRIAPGVSVSREYNVHTQGAAQTGSRFPMVERNTRNIDILVAWRNITSDPQFMDSELNELRSILISKARSDGMKVVVEPESWGEIERALVEKRKKRK